MKKRFVCAGIGLVTLIIVALIIAVFSLGSIVKNRIETVGPMVAQVEVKLDNADVWLVPGHVVLKGLKIANPPSYKSKTAIEAGEISVRMNFLSALSQKTIIDQITLQSPEITLEGGLRKNNLIQIRDNVEQYSAQPADSPELQPNKTAPPAAGPSAKRYQINELLIRNARLHIVSLFNIHEDVTIPLPDIHLYRLGAGPEGITVSEAAKKTLNALIDSVAANAGDTIASLSKEAITGAKKFNFKKPGQKLFKIFGQ